MKAMILAAIGVLAVAQGSLQAKEKLNTRTLVLLQERDPVASWIAKLSDETISVRDQAAAELAKLGDAAIKPLKELHGSTADPELKLRAAAILTKIDVEFRRKNFDGGEEVAGLKLRLGVEKAEVKAGTDLKLTIEIMNVAADSRPFVSPRGTHLALPNYVIAGHEAWITVTVTRVKGKAPELLSGENNSVRPGVMRPVDLAPGAGWIREVSLGTAPFDPNELRKLPPGEYDIQATYLAETYGLLKEAKSDIFSKKVRVTITE